MRGRGVLMPSDFEVREASSRRLRLLALVDAELDRATRKFDRFHSPHEGWAVIREELDELWEHVRADGGRSAEAAVEALQVATMALRYVYDLSPHAPLPDEEDALRDYLERFRRISS
jgi:hypothetical protein